MNKNKKFSYPNHISRVTCGWTATPWKCTDEEYSYINGSAIGQHFPVFQEISPEYSLEGLILRLKLQYFGHLMRRIDSLEKTLMLGGIGGRRRRGWQRMRWLDGITDSMLLTPGVGDGQGGLVCCDSRGRRVGHDWATELNWTELKHKSCRERRVLLVPFTLAIHTTCSQRFRYMFSHI